MGKSNKASRAIEEMGNKAVDALDRATNKLEEKQKTAEKTANKISAFGDKLQGKGNKSAGNKRKKIYFVGSFGGYFFKSLGLLVLSVLSCGILLPYFAYWSVKYFVNNLEVEA